MSADNTGGPTKARSIRMAAIRDELEQLAAIDTLDDTQATRWAELTTEFDELRKAHEAATQRAADIATIRAAVTNPSDRIKIDEPVVRSDDTMDRDPMADANDTDVRTKRNPWDLTRMTTFGRSEEQVAGELRSRAMDAIAAMPGATDSVRQAGTQILERFGDDEGRLARLTLALSSPAYMRAFNKAMRGAQLSDDEQRAVREAQRANRAMSLTDAAGGFLVPFQLDPTVIVTSDGSYNEIRNIARKVVATGDVWNGVSAGAVSWSFDAEAAAVSDDSPTLAQPSITIRTARGFVPISMEALADAANVTAEVGKLLALGKEDLESVVLITGAAASNQPIGIVTALTGTASVIPSAAADTLALADVSGLKSALPARHRQRASWLANDGFYSRVRPLDTSTGVWQDPAGDRPPRLYGKPVHEAEAMDGTLTALADNYMAIVGDFSNYVIADRIGMSVEFIPQLFDTATGRPTGQRGWFAHYRVGADSVLDAAFRMLNVT